MRKLISTLATLFLGVALFAIPRPEYPRPQFEREAWQNLNGEWTYTLDLVKTGWERDLTSGKAFDGKINVPFTPECKLSGVEHLDFIPCIWYQREITIPADWSGKDILLNFGAVYYESEVWIDGKFVNRHYGGSDSFSVDITKFVTPGKTHSLVVNASSDLRSRLQSAGKQSLRHGNFECMYTRTTGIWQTVWMEAVAPQGLTKVKTVTDIDRATVSFEVDLRRNSTNNQLSIKVYDGDKVVASSKGLVADGSIFTLPIKKMKLWAPGAPFLYDVVYELYDAEGKLIDKVESYFGMRKVHVEGTKVYINNQPFYQRLVLDQGFYPDGIWTAPSDEALRRDIELSMQAGFNGARLHQKVFEERFHYWADKLGYITWGESPSWGMDANDNLAVRNYLSEWANIMERDVNHPSIITWTPFNEEFWPNESSYPRFIGDIYDITKKIDPTRPVATVSGGIHILGKTDIWTEHNYEQDAEILRGKLYNPETGKMFQQKPLELCTRPRGNVGFNKPILNDPYTFPVYAYDMPYILDEFGGIKCMEANPSDASWGYGNATRTKEEFYKRLESQVKMLIEISDKIWGFCYTQLTDVQQEENGVYYFNRESKYDMARIREIFQMALPEQK